MLTPSVSACSSPRDRLPPVAPFFSRSASEGGEPSLSLGESAAVSVDTAARPPLGLTVAGALSLGSYEAGFLYYLTEALKVAGRVNRGPELKLVTGASAGNINALLSAMSVCENPTSDPERSPLFDAWVDVGLGDLLPDGQRVERSSLALLSDRVLHRIADKVKESWLRSKGPQCDVVLGVTATRVTPRRIPVGTGADKIQRQQEEFVVQIRRDQPDGPLQLRNYPTDTSGSSPVSPARLPFVAPRGDGSASAVNFDLLRSVLLASAAYPLLFPPVPVTLCHPYDHGGRQPPSAGDHECAGMRLERDVLLLDGGVFDNTPLRLAYRTVRSGLVFDREKGPQGSWTWSHAPPKAGDQASIGLRAMLFGLMDPDTTAYPTIADDPRVAEADVAGRTRQPRELADAVPAFVEGFINSARSRELDTLREEWPDLAKQVVLSKKHWPATGEALLSLFDFMERDFRVFDFYLGMLDGQRFMRRCTASDTIQCTGSLGEPLAKGPKQGWFDADEAMKSLLSSPALRTFRCIGQFVRAYSGGQQGAPSTSDECSGRDLQPYRILAQIALDRLYFNCRVFGDRNDVRQQAACWRARQGELPPYVEGLPVVDEWWPRCEQGEGPDCRREDDLAYALRLLEAYGYEYQDLGRRRSAQSDPRRRLTATEARVAIVRQLRPALDELAERQSWPMDQLVRTVGGLSLAQIQYLPVPLSVYAAVGLGSELGVDAAPSARHPWLHLGMALQFLGLGDLVRTGDTRLALAPVAGLNLEPYSTSLLRVGVGPRVGVSLAADDRAGARSCNRDDFRATYFACTTPVVQLMSTAVLIDRLRLHVGLEVPLRGIEDTFRFAAIVQLGLNIWNFGF